MRTKIKKIKSKGIVKDSMTNEQMEEEISNYRFQYGIYDMWGYELWTKMIHV